MTGRDVDSERLPGEAVDALRALPTLTHGPSFWDDLRAELQGGDDKTSPTGREEVGRHRRYILVAAVLLAALIGAALLRSGQATRIDTIPARPPAEFEGETGSGPIGPLDYVVHGSINGGRTLVGTRRTGQQSACYPEEGDRKAQPGFVNEMLLIDSVGGTPPQVVGELTGDDDEWFDRSIIVAADTVVGFSWCHPPAGQLSFVSSNSPDHVTVEVEPPPGHPYLTTPVVAPDGETVLVTYYQVEGEKILGPRKLVSYESSGGALIEERDTELTLLALLADGTRIARNEEQDLLVDGVPAVAAYSPWFDSVEYSSDGDSVAVFGQSGLVIFTVGQQEPLFETVTRDVSDVAWLPDGSLLVAYGGRPDVSEVEHLRLGETTAQATAKSVRLGLAPMHVETLTWAVGDRLAVSGFTGRDSNATWIVDLDPVLDGAADPQVDPLEELIPAAQDFGPGWQRLQIDLGAGGIQLHDQCDGSVSTVLPQTTAMVEYGDGEPSDDGLALIAIGSSEEISTLAADLARIVQCDDPTVERQVVTTASGDDVEIQVYSRTAIVNLGDRLLLVATEQTNPADVLQSVVARISKRP